MDGKTHVSRSMRETYVFQNACIMYVKKRTLNAWCSINAFNVRFQTYVLRTLNICCTFCYVNSIKDTNTEQTVPYKSIWLLSTANKIIETCVKKEIIKGLTFLKISFENIVWYFELFWLHIYPNAPNTGWRYIAR